MSSNEPTVLESFGCSTDPFVCPLCTHDRRYYDLLSDNRMVCLECSEKRHFKRDPHVVIHNRDPASLATDHELIEIRNNLVMWELEQGSIKLDELSVPRDVAEQLLEATQREGVTLDVVVTVALRMLFSAYRTSQSQETIPVLPEQAVQD